MGIFYVYLIVGGFFVWFGFCKVVFVMGGFFFDFGFFFLSVLWGGHFSLCESSYDFSQSDSGSIIILAVIVKSFSSGSCIPFS